MTPRSPRPYRGAQGRTHAEAGDHIRANSTYSCGYCGRVVQTPERFYAHLDAKHPREKAGDG